ncbi:LOW QUALITY PROTEIN: ferric reduction oxidase 2-like [Aristolochia californica]|uniref:LOW QUALITY PROTEIN: ferric reduction oxidase 2-like n=1 Tax=Aristolochia californica TaxID=171875 RepID=UPI0035D54EF5
MAGRVARAAIAFLIAVVFVGWMLLWVMMPTNTYKQKWQPKIRAHANSTYFGAQGANLLTSVFPVLFMAVLGCIYLHLGKDKDCQKKSCSRGKTNRLSVWRRPVLVKGPLGIVSGIELTLLAMFVALLIWAFTSFLQTSFAKINAKSAHQLGDKVWQEKLDSAALRLGVVGAICFAFLFFPVTRGSSLLPLLGLTSEGSVKYHIWLGHIVMTLFTAHGLCYIVYWATENEISQMLKWDKIGVSNVAGELALICGLLMWVTSFPRLRRKTFEVFYYTHHLYFLFFFFFVLHVGVSFFGLVLPGIFLFLVDRYLRFLQSRQRVRLLSARLLPCQALELSFSKSPGLSYSPTSIMFVNVPSISRIQWHPFTVTSNSSLEQDKLSVVIKCEGSWSEKLYQILSSPSPVEKLDVSVEGPYGPASTNLFRYEKLIMISGGSGITPFISIIRELIFQSSTRKQQIPQVQLVCSQLVCIVRNSEQLAMIDLLLPLAGNPCDITRLQLQIDAHVTREKGPNNENKNQKLLRTLWFKPNPSDVPVSAVLGPNSWLWLGAIISSSFVIFLLLLGITTRYYIYPIDYNTNKIFPYSSRSLLNVLFICVSIVMTASAAVLWNKKQSAMEANQIQNMEGITPTTSPGSWFYNGDRELESLPHQSLSQSIKVHFGARPDLQKILLEFDESSVGVLASGPKEMRHRVAAICSSGLAENLHFESISFTW